MRSISTGIGRSPLTFDVGRELFVGRGNDGPVGTFTTTYTFESQWNPDVTTGHGVSRRCQHPIVRNSGTNGLRGTTGYLGFTDIVTDGSYRHHGLVHQT
jgi:hypothetical protein